MSKMSSLEEKSLRDFIEKSAGEFKHFINKQVCL